MRRIIPFILALATATASAGPRSPQTSRILSGVGAGAAGAVTMLGFLTVPSGKAFNAPVLYTGVGMLFVTPSLGQFYSGQYLTWGMGVRALATGFAMYTLSTQTRAVVCDEPGTMTRDLNCSVFKENAYPLLGVAAIAFVGGVWYDALDAGDAADRYNASNGFSVAPAVLPGPNGTAPGVVFGGQF